MFLFIVPEMLKNIKASFYINKVMTFLKSFFDIILSEY